MRGHGAEYETSPPRSGGFTPPFSVVTRISHARPRNLPIIEAGDCREHCEGGQKAGTVTRFLVFPPDLMSQSGACDQQTAIVR